MSTLTFKNELYVTVFSTNTKDNLLTPISYTDYLAIQYTQEVKSKTLIYTLENVIF